MAHEIFPVKQFIPRPALCRRCWTVGHPEETCTTSPICKQCSQEHQPLTICLNPPKCPTCAKPGHAAGTLECPRYANKQQIIKFAYENKIPIAEASKLLNNPSPVRPPQLPRIQPPSKDTYKELEAMRKEIESLKSQVSTLAYTTARITALDTTVEGIQEDLAPIVNLPQTIDAIKRDMATGFQVNSRKVVAITVLLRGNRPAAKPPPIKTPTTNTTDKQRK